MNNKGETEDILFTSESVGEGHPGELVANFNGLARVLYLCKAKKICA